MDNINLCQCYFAIEEIKELDFTDNELFSYEVAQILLKYDLLEVEDYEV